MKKILALMLVLVIGMSLVACGGPDKGPAINKFNETSTAFNAVCERIEENIDMFDESNIATMEEMTALLNQYDELLGGNTEISQEQLDEIVQWLTQVEEWAASVDAELDAYLG